MRISVIIPCFNVEAYVQRAVESALAQTHPDTEVICVDDGSTDGTVVMLEELRARSEGRVMLIEQANQGACAARNKGLSHATGSYIQFLDADDRILPEKVAHQAALTEADGFPDVIVGSSVHISASGTTVREEVHLRGERDPWLDLMAHRLGGTPQNLWKRDALVAVNGWTVGLGSSQEYDLMFRILQQGGRAVYDERILTEVYQRSSGSISQTALDRNWERFVELRARVVAHLRASHAAQDLSPYYQILFDSIRTLYLFAPKKALAYHRELLPPGFTPRRSPATGGGYLLLHRLFGFAGAQRIRSLFG